MTAGLLTLALAAPVAAAGDATAVVLHGSPDAPRVPRLLDGRNVPARRAGALGDITGHAAVPGGTCSVRLSATADRRVCPTGPIDLTFVAGSTSTVADSALLASIGADLIRDTGDPSDDRASTRTTGTGTILGLALAAVAALAFAGSLRHGGVRVRGRR